jgi:hypothetical protein
VPFFGNFVKKAVFAHVSPASCPTCARLFPNSVPNRILAYFGHEAGVTRGNRNFYYMEDPFGNIIEIYSHSYELHYSSGAYES